MIGVKMNGIVSNNYVSNYTPHGQLAGSGQQSSANSGAEKPTYEPAINVTLSQAAQAALAGEQHGGSAEATLNKLKDLLERLGRSSPLDGDTLAVDLSGFSRGEIFAISSNSGNMFSEEEQKAAQIDLDERRDAALKGGYAVMSVTGSYTDLYESALEYLESAGSEEKKTTSWQAQYNALKQAEKYLDENPGIAPRGIANDPVADYLERTTDGKTSTNDNINGVTDEARKVLDSINDAQGRMDRLSGFGSRALSAIALNTSDQFSNSEAMAAKHEMKSRVRANVQGAFQLAGMSGDPTAFSKRLIAQYSSMSAAEREAGGLDGNYYDAIVKNYETSLRISQAFNTGPSSGGTASLLNFL